MMASHLGTEIEHFRTERANIFYIFQAMLFLCKILEKYICDKTT